MKSIINLVILSICLAQEPLQDGEPQPENQSKTEKRSQANERSKTEQQTSTNPSVPVCKPETNTNANPLTSVKKPAATILTVVDPIDQEVSLQIRRLLWICLNFTEINLRPGFAEQCANHSKHLKTLSIDSKAFLDIVQLLEKELGKENQLQIEIELRNLVTEFALDKDFKNLSKIPDEIRSQIRSDLVELQPKGIKLADEMKRDAFLELTRENPLAETWPLKKQRERRSNSFHEKQDELINGGQKFLDLKHLLETTPRFKSRTVEPSPMKVEMNSTDFGLMAIQALELLRKKVVSLTHLQRLRSEKNPDSKRKIEVLNELHTAGYTQEDLVPLSPLEKMRAMVEIPKRHRTRQKLISDLYQIARHDSVADALANGSLQEALWAAERTNSESGKKFRDELISEMTRTLDQAKADENAFKGASENSILTFPSGLKGIFKPYPKNLSERLLAERDNRYGEVLAYKLDQALGLHRVPLTTEIDYKGRLGSLQLMVEHASTPAQVNHLAWAQDGFGATSYEALAFDFLIDDIERMRNPGNILKLNHAWNYDVLIDNAKAFAPAGVDLWKRFLKKSENVKKLIPESLEDRLTMIKKLETLRARLPQIKEEMKAFHDDPVVSKCVEEFLPVKINALIQLYQNPKFDIHGYIKPHIERMNPVCSDLKN